MADLSLRTYRARTVGDALVEIKRDLGPDAVILHTRQFKAGGLLGLWARPIVEITATSASNIAPRHDKPGPRPSRDTGAPMSPRAARAAASGHHGANGSALADRLRQAYATPGASPDSGAGGVAIAPAPGAGQRAPESAIDPVTNGKALVAALATRAQIAPTTSAAVSALENELGSIKTLLNQVLARTSGSPASVVPELLHARYIRMLDADVSSEIADHILAEVRDELSRQEMGDEAIVHAAVVRRLSAALRIPGEEAAIRPRKPSESARRIALVGPTGVGKTTTVAKLAATHKLRHGLKVGLVTADTYRIAAVDQLRTYANIIGLPLRVALTPADMAAACDSLHDCDVVLIDTAGRAPCDADRLDELRDLLGAAKPHETHLVLSSTTSERAMLQVAERFSVVSPNRLIFTKLDEAANFGTLVNVAKKVGVDLSYLTTGQEVPDRIEPVRPDRIARLILEGGVVR